MGPWYSAEGLFFPFSYCIVFLGQSYLGVKLLIMHLAKAKCRRLFSSLGLNPHRRSDLKLLRRSQLYHLLQIPDPAVRDRLLASSLAATVKLAGSKNRRSLQQAADFLLLKSWKDFWRKKKDLRHDTRLLLSAVVKA